MRRGAKIIAVHFSIASEEEKVKKYVEKLSEFSPRDVELIVVPYRENLQKYSDALRQLKKQEWICVFCKYGMLKKAGEIAEKEGALGIVTGDSLGQVASQTLENMRIISTATKIPIYRPLIGLDKIDIERMARDIGTYDVFLYYGEKKCPFRPNHVVVQGNYKKFEDILKKVQSHVF